MVPIFIYIYNKNFYIQLITLLSNRNKFIKKLNNLFLLHLRFYSINNNSDNLSYYLAGLIEGDGHFNVPKFLYSDKVKTRIAGIEIIFALKDKPSAELLRNKFGGNVYLDSKKRMVRWMIKDIKSVTKIVNLINGKLRTPKINGFYKMIDFLKMKGVEIEKLSLDTSPLNNNAWLAGFIDADGHFAIKGFTSNIRTYLAIHFYISQRKTDISGETLENIMEKIADFLFTKLSYRIFHKKYNQFVINTSNNKSNQILIDYLNTFPLLSSKYLDFKDWEKASNIFTQKLHRDPVQYEKIRLLKSNMNKNRILFSWFHHNQIIYGLLSI